MSDEPALPRPLPLGTLIRSYRVEAVRDRGETGIVYRARDERDGSPALLLEYLPLALAIRRGDGLGVEPLPDRQARFIAGGEAFARSPAEVTGSGIDAPGEAAVFASHGTLIAVLPGAGSPPMALPEPPSGEDCEATRIQAAAHRTVLAESAAGATQASPEAATLVAGRGGPTGAEGSTAAGVVAAEGNAADETEFLLEDDVTALLAEQTSTLAEDARTVLAPAPPPLPPPARGRRRRGGPLALLAAIGAVGVALWFAWPDGSDPRSASPLDPAPGGQLTEPGPSLPPEPYPEPPLEPDPEPAPEPLPESESAPVQAPQADHLDSDPGAAVVTRGAPLVFRDVLDDGTPGPDLVALPGGRFSMGCVSGLACSPNEEPVHQRILRPFAIMIHEVSFAAYDAFVQATGAQAPGDRTWGRGSQPVIYVAWDDARAYARWLSERTGERYRLPSEAEWEYAARAGTTTAFSWGVDVASNRANCKACGSRWDDVQTAPVGSFPANPWGLFDMHGNVREWVEDCYRDGYQQAPADGAAATWPGCETRVLRGGSWDFPPAWLRSARRVRANPEYRFDNIGFRLVRELDSAPAP